MFQQRQRESAPGRKALIGSGRKVQIQWDVLDVVEVELWREDQLKVGRLRFDGQWQGEQPDG